MWGVWGDGAGGGGGSQITAGVGRSAGPLLFGSWEPSEGFGRGMITPNMYFGINTVEKVEKVPTGANQGQGSC